MYSYKAIKQVEESNKMGSNCTQNYTHKELYTHGVCQCCSVNDHQLVSGPLGISYDV